MRVSALLLLVAVLLLATPGTAAAYIGPGAGLALIGTVLGVIAAIGLAILGFIWYPIKRMIAKAKGRSNSDTPQELNPL